MACRDRDSSADSKKYHDNEEVESKEHVLSDEEKTQCIQILHCSKAKKKSPNTYITSTSHWIKRTEENNVSRFAYRLFKVKRWLLVDENLIFDPLKAYKIKCQVTPSNTLWRPFAAEKQCEEESSRSVDGLLSTYLTPEQRTMIKKLGHVMAPLDKVNAHDILSVERILPELTNNLRNLPDNSQLSFTTTEFIAALSQTLIHHATGTKMRETEFEDIFIWLVACITAALGFPYVNRVRCWRSVDHLILKTVTVPIQIGNEEMSLQIRSKPDMFVFKRDKVDGGAKNVLCVIEAKGLDDGAIIQSDDEFDHETHEITRCIQHLCTEPKKLPHRGRKGASECSGESKLAALDEDLEEEEDLQNFMDDHPSWLKRIPPEMHSVVKKFLPQLMGQMFCCARSTNLQMKTPNGFHFGIGLVGLEVFFVAMKESCDNNESKSDCIINKDGYTNLFITRPLNLLVQKDRQIIIKTLAALYNF